MKKIVSQSTAPSNKNVGWWNGKELKFYTNGQWKTSGGSSGGSNTPFLDIIAILDKHIPVLNMYKINETHPVEDFGITSEFLNSFSYDYLKGYSDRHYYIDAIYDAVNNVKYENGGYLKMFDSDLYEITIILDDGDESLLNHKLYFDFLNKTATLINRK